MGDLVLQSCASVGVCTYTSWPSACGTLTYCGHLANSRIRVTILVLTYRVAQVHIYDEDPAGPFVFVKARR